MAFWSGEKLKEELSAVIPEGNSAQIENAAYALKIGKEIYIPPTRKWLQRKKKRFLKDKEEFDIPPGQFAFLTTEETISVPPSILALISIKARIKWKGLVNVSGFHVDPGFEGKLIFTVFNAGPRAITLKQGQRCFLIWFADLDRTSESPYARNQPGQTGIDLELINGMAGPLITLDSLEERLRKVESDHKAIKYLFPVAVAVFGVLIALVLGIVPAKLWRGLDKPPATSEQVVSPAVGDNANSTIEKNTDRSMNAISPEQ